VLEDDQAVQLLADTLEKLGAPLGLPEDWIVLCDHDDLRFMRRPAAKKLLARAKRETARRWLHARFDPSEMQLELSEECDCGDVTSEFDFAEMELELSEGCDSGGDTSDFEDGLLKQRAVKSIDDVVSEIESFRELYRRFPNDDGSMPSAHAATVAARLEFGYPEERPSRTDCFDEDVRRQCRRVVNEIYKGTKNSSGPVVYVISAGDSGFAKIGFTTCLEQRLRSLRTASHVEPVVHAVIPGTRSLERELHRRFASARHNREWFRLTKEIEAFIATERGSSDKRSVALATVHTETTESCNQQ
jgi:hypothetical protein